MLSLGALVRLVDNILGSAPLGRIAFEMDELPNHWVLVLQCFGVIHDLVARDMQALLVWKRIDVRRL